MADIEKKLDKKIARAIIQYNMIEEGDRVLVAVSGGKDSMSLVYHLLKKQKSFPINFEMGAIHIKTDFCNCGKKTRMETYLQKWNVPYEILPVPVIKRLKPGKKMNCYWCSTQRRMELIRYASENGYNKIALGHHMDDILETFFMNMAYKGELSTMLPVLKYDRYPHTVIRPLAFVKEKEIIEFATEKEINKLVCTCPYGKKSKRKDMRDVINYMCEDAEHIRDNIYKALGNPVPRYMMGGGTAEDSPEESPADHSASSDTSENSSLDGPVPVHEEEPENRPSDWMRMSEEKSATSGADASRPCDTGEDCPAGADCSTCS